MRPSLLGAEFLKILPADVPQLAVRSNNFGLAESV